MFNLKGQNAHIKHTEKYIQRGDWEGAGRKDAVITTLEEGGPGGSSEMASISWS